MSRILMAPWLYRRASSIMAWSAYNPFCETFMRGIIAQKSSDVIDFIMYEEIYLWEEKTCPRSAHSSGNSGKNQLPASGPGGTCALLRPPIRRHAQNLERNIVRATPGASQFHQFRTGNSGRLAPNHAKHFSFVDQAPKAIRTQHQVIPGLQPEGLIRRVGGDL